MERLLVGVDGSESGNRALRWSMDEAAAHGATLIAVFVVERPAFYGVDVELSMRLSHDDPLKAAEAKLTDLVAETKGDRTVDVEAIVKQGDPRRVLREHSADVDLLVVGARGHGEVFGVLLGSVGQYLVTHAHCPVVVVRAPKA
jgi:nucleotide-binding universal stress UspA family protein